jgi:hypothetical protein
MARFSNLWDEAEHPRDRLGRFRNKWKIGGKAKAIVDAILDRFNPKTFPDFQRANNYGVERGWSRYTPEQKRSITSYVKGNFKAVDAELKQGKESPESKAIDSAMHPLEDDLILTRSFSPERFGLAANDAQAAEELTGKLIASKTYQNAWMGPATNNGGIQLHILAPRGTPAVFSGGAEVMMSRDQPLRITRAERVPDGSVRLYAVAVPHGTAGNMRPSHDVPGAVHAGRVAGNEPGVPQENIPNKPGAPSTAIPAREAPNPRAGEITPAAPPPRDLGDTPGGIEADGRPSWTHGGQPIELHPATGSPGGGGITAKAGNQTLIQDAPDMESLAVEADRAGLPEVAKWARANQRFVKGSDAPAAGQRAAARAALARQEANTPAPEPNAPNAPAPNAPAAPAQPEPNVPPAAPAAPTTPAAPAAPAGAAAPTPAPPPAAPNAPAEPAPLPTPVEPAPTPPAPPTPSSSPQVPVDISQPVPADATPEVRAAHAEALRKAGEDAARQNPPAPAPVKTAARAARVKKVLAPKATKAAPAPVAAPPAPVATEPPSTMPAKKVAKKAAAKVTAAEKAVPEKAVKKVAAKAVKAAPEPAKATTAAPEKAVKKAAKKAVKAAPEPTKATTPAAPERAVKKVAAKAAPAKRVAKPKLTPAQEAQQNAEHDVANREQRKIWSDAIPGGEPKDLRELEKTQLDQTAEFIRTKKWSKKRAVEELRGFARNRSDTHAAYLNKVADFLETQPRAPRKATVKKALAVPSVDQLRGISNSEERLKALDGLDVASLRKIASEAAVPGRSKLTKEALKKAISDHLGATKAEAPAKAISKAAKKAAVPAKAVAKKAEAPAKTVAKKAAKAAPEAPTAEAPVKAAAKAVKAVQPAKKRAARGSLDDFLARDSEGVPIGDRVAARILAREKPEDQKKILDTLSPEHRAQIQRAIEVNQNADQRNSLPKPAAKVAKKAAVKAAAPAVAPVKEEVQVPVKKAGRIRDLTFKTPEDVQQGFKEGRISGPAAVKRLREHAEDMRQWATHGELGSTMGRGVTEGGKPSTTSKIAIAENKRRLALAAEYDRIADEIEGKTTPTKAAKTAVAKTTRAVPGYDELVGMKSREEVAQRLDGLTVAQLKEVAKEGGVIHSASVLKPRLQQAIVDKAVGNRLDTSAILGTNEADREAVRVAAVAKARARKAAAQAEAPKVAEPAPVKKAAKAAAKAVKSAEPAAPAKVAPVKAAKVTKKAAAAAAPEKHTREELMDMGPGQLKDIEDELGVERPSLLRSERVDAILKAQAGEPPAKKTAAQRLAAFKEGNKATKAAAPAKSVEAKAVQRAESSKGAIQAGKFSDKPVPKNGWGTGTGEIQYHPDGAIGTELSRMGEDRKLDVDGLPLETVLGHIATDTVKGRTTTNEMLTKLKDLQKRLPEGGKAKSGVTHMIAQIDSAEAGSLHVPSGTPAPVEDLLTRLKNIPLARKERTSGNGGPGELGRLVGIIQDFHGGRLSPLRLIKAVQDLENGRHESQEGKIELDHAIGQAVRELKALSRDAKTKSQLLPPAPKLSGGGGELTPDRESEIEQAIRSAYHSLVLRPGQYVTLEDLRSKLPPGLPRDQVDEVLRRLNRRPDVTVTPEVNQKMLTPAARESAVIIGNVPKHAIAIGHR